MSHVVEVENLVKRFRSPEGETQTVIDVPSFSLEEGKQLALCGGSGTGKTTFLNLIAGILKPDSGRVTVCGKEMSILGEADRDRLRAASIGYIFQTFNLLQGFSCLENVLLGMAFSGKSDTDQATKILDRVGLGHRLHHSPGQLSTGQQQRVAVARALVNRPKLVLADEPTGNLDPENAKQSLALIRETCADIGAALLLVSHDQMVLDQFEAKSDLAQINSAAKKEVAA